MYLKNNKVVVALHHPPDLCLCTCTSCVAPSNRKMFTASHANESSIKTNAYSSLKRMQIKWYYIQMYIYMK